MNIEEFRAYCLSKKGTTEEFPFDKQTLVFKVMGKMFALTDVDLFESVNLKVEPEVGAELRDKYGFVREAYHMNKKHWITVFVGEGVSDKLLMSWIDTSYQLVTNGLTKSQKLTLDT